MYLIDSPLFDRSTNSCCSMAIPKFMKRKPDDKNNSISFDFIFSEIHTLLATINKKANKRRRKAPKTPETHSEARPVTGGQDQAIDARSKPEQSPNGTGLERIFLVVLYGFVVFMMFFHGFLLLGKGFMLVILHCCLRKSSSSLVLVWNKKQNTGLRSYN